MTKAVHAVTSNSPCDPLRCRRMGVRRHSPRRSLSCPRPRTASPSCHRVHDRRLRRGRPSAAAPRPGGRRCDRRAHLPECFEQARVSPPALSSSGTGPVPARTRGHVRRRAPARVPKRVRRDRRATSAARPRALRARAERHRAAARAPSCSPSACSTRRWQDGCSPARRACSPSPMPNARSCAALGVPPRSIATGPESGRSRRVSAPLAAGAFRRPHAIAGTARWCCSSAS